MSHGACLRWCGETEACLWDPPCSVHNLVDRARYRMVEDLQRAVEGSLTARPWSPREEWGRLLTAVRQAVSPYAQSESPR
jgi:hypothetical protein